MSEDRVWSKKLEKHDTKDTKDGHVNGSLTVVWREWENYIKTQPKMVYVSSVLPHQVKGPHLHKKRTSYFVCIHGKVVFIIKEGDKYTEIKSGHEDPILVCVPKNVASAHINLSDGVSRVLAIADLAWRPNDDEMVNVEFSDYDWSKWQK